LPYKYIHKKFTKLKEGESQPKGVCLNASNASKRLRKQRHKFFLIHWSKGQRMGACSPRNKGTRQVILVIMISNAFYPSSNDNQELPSLTPCSMKTILLLFFSFIGKLHTIGLQPTTSPSTLLLQDKGAHEKPTQDAFSNSKFKCHYEFLSFPCRSNML